MFAVRFTRAFGLALALCFLAAGAQPAERVVSPAYQAEIEAWRGQREARLRADSGWLTLAGLFWLKPGANTLGSGAGSDVAEETLRARQPAS